MKGMITRLTDRGFGFVKPCGSDKDVFFHAKELKGIMFDELKEGDLVEFDTIQGEKGIFAANIARNGGDYSAANEDAPASEGAPAEQEEGAPAEEEEGAGAIAADVRVCIQQLSSKLAEMVARNPSALDTLEWRDLERMVAEVFDGIGLDVVLTPGSKDVGKDVVISYFESGKRMSYIVEIKHWTSRQRVGTKHVEEFVHVVANEKRSGGLFLSTYGYARTSIEYILSINRTNIGFGAMEKIVGLCKRYVRAKEGCWVPESELSKVIFEDTLDSAVGNSGK